MKAALTLINIYEEDIEKVGFRAVDLARIQKSNYSVPLSFVIPCQVFDEFIEQSGIGVRLPKIYSKYTQDKEGFAQAYADIHTLFDKINFSEHIAELLCEAYESLAIPTDTKSMDSLVSNEQEPQVTLLPSPTYLQVKEMLVGYQQNVFGKKAFLEAVKESWLSLYLPEAVLQRVHSNITSFSTGIIVQQQVRGASAQSTYKQEQEVPITIHSHFGLLDKAGAVTKDEHHVQVEHLKILKAIIREQAYKLVADDNSGELAEAYLQEKGREQKFTDKQLLEVARLTKRIHVLLGKNLKFYFSVRDDLVSIHFVLRISSHEQLPTDLPVKVVAENDIQDFGINEEEYDIDPDQEDLGLPSQEQALAVDDTVLDEIEAEENPIIVFDQEEPIIEAYEDEPEGMQEPYQESFLELQQESYQDQQQEPFQQQQQEPYHDNKQESPQEPYQEQPDDDDSTIFLDEDSDEESEIIIEEETQTQSSPQQEETLFDLFGADKDTEQEYEGQSNKAGVTDDSPEHSQDTYSITDSSDQSQKRNELSQAQSYIMSCLEQLHEHLVRIHKEHYNEETQDFNQLLEELAEAGALSFDKEELLFLYDSTRLDEEPEDHLLGLAWRIQSYLKQ